MRFQDAAQTLLKNYSILHVMGHFKSTTSMAAEIKNRGGFVCAEFLMELAGWTTFEFFVHFIKRVMLSYAEMLAAAPTPRTGKNDRPRRARPHTRGHRRHAKHHSRQRPSIRHGDRKRGV